MDVSVIIVNYNTKTLTLNCINSVFEKTEAIDFEIILVDNASTDGSKELFEKDKRITYIYSNKNLGFGGANNLGIQSSKGDYILLLNPDTLLINNAIAILFNYYRSHSNIGGVGGNLYDIDMKPCLSYRRYLPGIRWEINDLTFGLLDRLIYGSNRTFNTSSNPITVGYITGADLMISREIFNRIKGFDSSFFLYYEETDLCKRITNLGYKIISEPKAKIIHLEGKSFNEKISSTRIRRTEEGRKNYYINNIKRPIRLFTCNIIRGLCLQIKSKIDPRANNRILAKEQLSIFNEIWK